MTKVWLGKLPLLILGQLNFLSPSFMCHTYIAPAMRQPSVEFGQPGAAWFLDRKRRSDQYQVLGPMKIRSLKTSCCSCESLGIWSILWYSPKREGSKKSFAKTWNNKMCQNAAANCCGDLARASQNIAELCAEKAWNDGASKSPKIRHDPTIWSKTHESPPYTSHLQATYGGISLAFDRKSTAGMFSQTTPRFPRPAFWKH